MGAMKIWRTVSILFLTLTVVGAEAQQSTNQSPSQHTIRTRVVLLGTGTPVPDPDRSGPATAIVVGDSAYLVDFGPGVVRRAEAAVLDRCERIPTETSAVSLMDGKLTPTKSKPESFIRTKRSGSQHLQRNMQWRVTAIASIRRIAVS